MSDEKKVIELCYKYKLVYKYFGDKVIITTDTDQWAIFSKQIGWSSGISYGDQVYELKHENDNKTGKAHFHRQRIIRKLEQVFDIIVEHQPKIG